MPSLRGFVLPTVVATLMLAPTAASAAATPPPATQAAVDLTYDVTVAWLVAASQADNGFSQGPSGYLAETLSRPSAAPMPTTSPVTQLVSR
jgi:hypothetical protein